MPYYSEKSKYGVNIWEENFRRTIMRLFQHNQKESARLVKLNGILLCTISGLLQWIFLIKYKQLNYLKYQNIPG